MYSSTNGDIGGGGGGGRSLTVIWINGCFNHQSLKSIYLRKIVNAFFFVFVCVIGCLSIVYLFWTVVTSWIFIWKKIFDKTYIYTLQTSNATHDFDRLYFFFPGFLFLKFDILRKPVGLFHWGALHGLVNWGEVQKEKLLNFIRLYEKCMLCQVFGLYARTHCPFIVPKSSGALNGQWVPNACIQSQKECAKLHI